MGVTGKGPASARKSYHRSVVYSQIPYNDTGRYYGASQRMVLVNYLEARARMITLSIIMVIQVLQCNNISDQELYSL